MAKTLGDISREAGPDDPIYIGSWFFGETRLSSLRPGKQKTEAQDGSDRQGEQPRTFSEDNGQGRCDQLHSEAREARDRTP